VFFFFFFGKYQENKIFRAKLKSDRRFSESLSYMALSRPISVFKEDMI